MVAMDGHQGPKEINVQPDFLAFLRNPALNGAGALFDFGCYGANLMTWLMDNQPPTAVMAITRHFKPEIYPDVDDDATILLEYPKAQGVIEASWNWPYSRKELEVYAKAATPSKSEEILCARKSATRPKRSARPRRSPLTSTMRCRIFMLSQEAKESRQVCLRSTTM
jgi:predicted dehydrogenase